MLERVLQDLEAEVSIIEASTGLGTAECADLHQRVDVKLISLVCQTLHRSEANNAQLGSGCFCLGQNDHAQQQAQTECQRQNSL